MATKQSGSSKSSSGKSSGGGASGGDPEAKKKTALIAVAVVCILVAAGMLAWQFGLFTKKEPPGLNTIVPVEQTIPEERKEEYKKNLKLIEEERAKSGTPAGS